MRVLPQATAVALPSFQCQCDFPGQGGTSVFSASLLTADLMYLLDFYDMKNDLEDYEEMVSPTRRPLLVLSEELYGFFSAWSRKEGILGWFGDEAGALWKRSGRCIFAEFWTVPGILLPKSSGYRGDLPITEPSSFISTWALR